MKKDGFSPAVGKRSPNIEVNDNQERTGAVREVVRATTFTVYVDTNKQTVNTKCHTINELLIVLGELQDQGLVDKPRVSTTRFTGRCQEGV